MKRFIVLAALISVMGLSGLRADETAPAPAPVEPPKETPQETPKETPKEAPKPAEPKKEEPRTRGRRGGEAGRPVANFFREQDKDADGKLSKDEFGNEKLFAELDADKDGFLTMQEAGKAGDKLAEEIKRRQKAAAEEEFKALDRDDDKKLTAEELGDRKSMLEKGDKNADKTLDLEEYSAARIVYKADQVKAAEEKAREINNKTPEEAFKELDKNSDGKIAGDEITERLKRAVTNADTDKDGALSLDEYKAMREKMAERMKDRKPGEGRRKRGGGEAPKAPEKSPEKPADPPAEPPKGE